MLRIVACAVLLLGASVAWADAPPPQVVQTTLAGRVTDVQGKPVARARVYVLPRGGERIVTTTDVDGRYAIALGGGGAYSVVIAVSHANTFRQVLATEHERTTLDVQVEIDIEGGEVISIVDARLPAPAVLPVPDNAGSRKSLPYSDEAVLRDAWARAWLLLDISDRGEVTRLKMLKRPGFGLDQIAIDEAFKLRFEPARDASGRAIRTYILWDMEWPSKDWLIASRGTGAGRPVAHDDLYARARQNPNLPGTGPAGGIDTFLWGDGAASGPAEGGQRTPFANDRRPKVGPHWQDSIVSGGDTPLDRVPCAGSGPLDLDRRNRAYRDCSRPDLKSVDLLPWITRDNAKTALRDLDATAPQRLPGRPRPKLPVYVAGAVTALSAVALGVSFFYYDRYSDLSASAIQPAQAGHVVQPSDKLGVWKNRMLGSAAGVVVSGAITAFLWGRSQTRESFSVQPTPSGGAALSWGRAF